MSLFWDDEIACPACGATMRCEVAASLNADRRPDLRAAILDGSYQRVTCEACGAEHRLQPELTYLETGRNQWILALPIERIRYWPDFEQGARDIFDAHYGPGAPATAQEIGADLDGRVAFGWSGLREKLLCRDAGIDDAALEALKLAMLRAGEVARLSDTSDLRLHGVADDTLLLGWFEEDADVPEEILSVPRAIYDEVASATDWSDLRSALTAGPFVDVNRLLVEDVTVALG